MAREFEVHSPKQFHEMVRTFLNYFDQREEKGLKFQSIRVISKRWVKPKSNRQHKLYWVYISELQKAFLDVGYELNQETLHDLIKHESGYTKMIEMPDGKMQLVTKSIADASDDVNCEEISKLIEFIKRYAAVNLNYYME